MPKNILVAISIAIAIIAGVALMRNRDTASVTTTPEPTPTATPLLSVTETPVSSPMQTTSVSVSGDVKEFTILARQFSFAPSTIRVKKGDRVKLTIKNSDVAHGIAISQLNVNLIAQAGETHSTEFVADTAGTFDFFCSVFCGSGHRGMKGQFIVE